ncbi:PBX1 [Mytilus edulis]|uniref:PBX1 n=1 Tax=Mytilus edulis TaxID=6550 RepID=A0A8S3T009_MYTED|nr:PBX1 [Mytilus edulis]
MNILDLHVNCHVALHPKQLEHLDTNQRYGYKNNSVIKDNTTQTQTIPNMDYEESAFKYQPFKRSSNDLETSSINYHQTSPLYNVYDKWHYYSMNPPDRYGASEYHNGIIPFGHNSYSDQNGSNSYVDVGYRRYASDIYGQMYDQQLPESSFYPYSSNFNPYLNLCDNNHQASSSYYQHKSRYPLTQNGYRNIHDTDFGSQSDQKTDNHWYMIPSSRTSGSASGREQRYEYESQTSYPQPINSAHQDKSTKPTANGCSYEHKMASQYGKIKQNGTGKGTSSFTLHVRKQERKLKKRLKELQGRNCDKATQLQEYYHYKVIMIEKQAQQRQQSDQILGSVESSEETDVQILQLVHEMDERINALQFTLNDDITDKYGQVCGEVRKTRLLPKHAIKTLENWYEDNLSNPYPSRDQTVRLALDCGLTIEQVRKWFANKRNRSRNNKLHLLK